MAAAMKIMKGKVPAMNAKAAKAPVMKASMKAKKVAAMKKKSSMKAKKKAPSVMKKKAMKVSVKGKKWQVFKGTRAKTSGGLQKNDLTKNKYGKVVSTKASKRSKANKWTQCVKKARTALSVKGFCPVGGGSKEGQALLAKARSFYKR